MTDHPAPHSLASTQDLERFFADLRSRSSPAVVWHGPGDQRVELSGRVLENWVAKSANLLVEELEVEPGSTLMLDAALHWRSLAVGLAALRVGARLLPVDLSHAARAEPWIGFSPTERGERSELRMLLGRGALAMSYDGDPAAVGPDDVDYCASIRSFADSYDPWAPLPERTEVAEGMTVRNWLDAVARAARREADGAGEAVALETSTAPVDAAMLAEAAGIMAAGRAVVLIEPEVPAGRRERVLVEERVATA